MKYRFFCWLLAVEALILAILLFAGYRAAHRMAPMRQENQRLVRVLKLTDLAIWTEARYTRHLSQADVFAAFQDSPGALEHFPAGALAPLPVPFAPAASADAVVSRETRDEPTS